MDSPVSVGEALAVAPLVEELPGGDAGGISTTTHTGQRLARQRFGEEERLLLPARLPFCIGPYLRRVEAETGGAGGDRVSAELPAAGPRERCGVAVVNAASATLAAALHALRGWI